ncbi:MAG: cobalamin biosynthesis protein [Jatrophihabitans sp.]
MLRSELIWPLPPLLTGSGPPVLVSDLLRPEPAAMTLLRPPSLVVGVGAVRNTPADHLLSMIERCLAEAGLAIGSVRALATAEVKADDAGMIAAARERGWPLRVYPSAVLARIAVPNPSSYVAAAIGTPSVAEAAALAGRQAVLILPKQHDAAVTVAVARHPPRGRLAVLSPAERPGAELRRCSIVLAAPDLALPLRPGARRIAVEAGPDALGTAVGLARLGHAVALISEDVDADALRAVSLAPVAADQREVDLSDSPPASR